MKGLEIHKLCTEKKVSIRTSLSLAVLWVRFIKKLAFTCSISRLWCALNCKQGTLGRVLTFGEKLKNCFFTFIEQVSAVASQQEQLLLEIGSLIAAAFYKPPTVNQAYYGNLGHNVMNELFSVGISATSTVTLKVSSVRKYLFCLDYTSARICQESFHKQSLLHILLKI